MKCVPHLAGKPPHSLILFCLNNASNTYINIPVLVLAFLFRRKAMRSNSLDTCGQTCVETRCYGISGGMCHGSNNLLHCLIICNVNRIIVVFYSTGNMEIWDGLFFCQTTQLESPKATTPLTLNYRMSYMIQCCHQSESSFAGVHMHGNDWLLVVKRNA